jgi:hypothetical protein
VFCSVAVRGRTVVEELEFCADVVVGKARTKRAVTKNIFLNKAWTPLALMIESGYELNITQGIHGVKPWYTTSQSFN